MESVQIAGSRFYSLRPFEGGLVCETELSAPDQPELMARVRQALLSRHQAAAADSRLRLARLSRQVDGAGNFLAT